MFSGVFGAFAAQGRRRRYRVRCFDDEATEDDDDDDDDDDD